MTTDGSHCRELQALRQEVTELRLLIERIQKQQATRLTAQQARDAAEYAYAIDVKPERRFVS